MTFPQYTAGITEPTDLNFLLGPKLFFILFKALFIIGILFYIIYAVIMIRQIQLMTETVKTKMSGSLILLGVIHLILALLLFGYFLIV